MPLGSTNAIAQLRRQMLGRGTERRLASIVVKTVPPSLKGSGRDRLEAFRANSCSRRHAVWMSPLATYQLDGHVATITYNRPESLNAIDGEMRRDLNEAFSRFRDEEEAWVAIVTGAGRSFCVGADMRGGAGAAGEFAGTFWERPTANSFESGWEIYKPVIAAVNGYCLGYGLTLVTWCDFVIASEQAEFGFPEVRLGFPTIVGAIRLPQRINWQNAMELLLTGDRISAERAKEIGLAGWVVPHNRLMDEARSLADRLVSAAPLAARAIKEVAVRSQSMAPVEAIRFGETMRIVASATEDAAEGRRAVAEARPPRWQGR
jgi:enoyl-CoA hydratase/carnithine racemase